MPFLKKRQTQKTTKKIRADKERQKKRPQKRGRFFVGRNSAQEDRL